MKTIKAKIIVSVFSIVLIVVLLMGVMISQKLDIVLSAQEGKLSLDMSDEINRTLHSFQYLLDELLEESDRATRSIVINPKIISFLESNNVEDIDYELQTVKQNALMDFAWIFDLKGQFVTSYPTTTEPSKTVKALETSKLIAHIRAAISQEEEVYLHEVFFYPSELLLLQQPDRSVTVEQGGVGVLSAAIFFDDYGDPQGFCLTGKLLNQYNKPLDMLHDISGDASAIYIGATAITASGFFDDEVTAESLSKLSLSEPDLAIALSSVKDKAVSVPLTIGKKTYLTSARELATSPGGEKGLMIVAISQDRLLEAKEILLANAVQTKKGVQSGILVIGLISALIAIVLAILFARSISEPMNKAVQMTKEIANGNLMARLDMNRNDEIGQLALAMNAMAGKLQTMVNQVYTSTTEIKGISHTITAASDQVSDSAKAQANKVVETSVATRGIIGSIEDISASVDQLSMKATESTSAVMEISASNEEVVQNTETLSVAVEGISSSVTEMTTSIQQVADGSETLKRSSDSAVASMNQMALSIGQVENNARDTADLTEKARLDAEIGQVSVETVIKGMLEIKQASHTMEAATLELAKKADEIGSILSVIDELNDQTNLLSLNAAIIAAQAGVHGRGFAVVADEIKELANRTSSSTNEVYQSIQDIQDETRTVSQSLLVVQELVDDGEKKSKQSGEALEKVVSAAKNSEQKMDEIVKEVVKQVEESKRINDAVLDVSSLVTQTASATAEQSKGSQMINRAVEEMKGLNLMATNSAREQSAASKQIAGSMEQINGLIQQIQTECTAQSEESKQILSAIADIEKSSQDNLETSEMINKVVPSLSAQVISLEEEMQFFQVDHATKERPVPKQLIRSIPTSPKLASLQVD